VSAARRTAVLTGLALASFAANSLLARAALRGGLVDPGSFTLVRLLAGALVLVLLAARAGSAGAAWRSGTVSAAVALFVYALAFSLAYLRLDAGTGALILFGVVQATMIGWGMQRGHRPSPLEWLGVAVALAGLVLLASPGLHAPDPAGAALMALAGVGWGVYSLLGRGTADPVATNASNFLRSVPFAVVASVVFWELRHVTASGLLLAAVSGAITSGLGYAVWYAALRGLTPLRAAVLQLAVPVLAAAGGIVLLGERLTLRLAGAGAIVLGGIALAVVAGAARPSRRSETSEQSSTPA
jgi:drug/metabolite transporter (DMT)-like permease